MHHKSRRILTARLVLGTALVLVPLAGFPLGLGKLKVRSALNEPLRADIEFTSITDAELKGLSTSLASRADFEDAGAERLPFLSQIKFNVVRAPDGRHVLELRTDQAVQEPFLHLLLQLEWPGGRLVREYSALIDPPHYVAGRPAGIEPPKVAAAPEPKPPKVESPAPEAVPVPVPETPVAEAPPVPAEPLAPPAEPQLAETPPPAPEAPMPEAIPPVVASDDAETFGPDQRRDVVVIDDSGWPDEDLAPKVEPLEPRPADTAQVPDAPPAEAQAPAPMPGDTVVAEAAPPSGDYAVKKGDTLWEIAQRARPDQTITVEQMSLAIFKRNSDAFFGNNLNNLRAGKVLKMPERDEVTAIPSADARRTFKVQYDSWQEYKLKLASARGGLKVADSKPAAAEAAPAPAPEPQPAAPAPVKPEARVTAGPEDRSKQPDELLRIVRGTLAGQKTTPEQKAAQGETPKDVARNEQSALAERASTLDESLESKQLEQKELGDKLGQVQSQIKNESRLLEIENQGLAKAQTQATPPAASPAESKPAGPPKAEPPAAAPKSEAAPLEAPKPVPAAPIPSAEPAKAAKAPPKRAPPPAPPVEEKGFFASLVDSVLGGSVFPIVGGVLALVGGVILLVYMRRRQRSIAEFEESILASDAVATDSAAPSDTTGQPATTGDTSFLSDFSQGGMGNVHTDEVDPIAEAEVYLAYGRDETAEEILKEAVVKNPERQELKLKLLEIYHQRNDVGAFETLAEELYAALAGRGGKVWTKVEEMGRKLNPENPMFRGGAPAERRADDRSTSPPAASAMFAGGAGAATAIAASPGAATDAMELDANFDFDAGSPAASPSAPAASDDFNIDFGSPEPAAPTAAVEFVPSTPAPSAVKQDDGLDGLDLDRAFADNVVEFSGSAASAPVAEELGVATAADDEIKWELDAPVAEAAPAPVESQASGAGGDQQQWDETATKLDLAKAYIDMGDAEGARSILDEVLAEGNEDQKRQAAQLATQIA